MTPEELRQLLEEAISQMRQVYNVFEEENNG
jgi:hypothetical protein